jgi:MoxR-like ATPase
VPDDIQAVFPSTMVHRVFFTPVYELRRAELADALVAQILERVPAP